MPYTGSSLPYAIAPYSVFFSTRVMYEGVPSGVSAKLS